MYFYKYAFFVEHGIQGFSKVPCKCCVYLILSFNKTEQIIQQSTTC